MFPIILTTLLLLQALLILSVPLNVYAELTLMPWLVSNGFVPYRDFFDHHGFLLYYLLAPFSNIQNEMGLLIFYLFLQSLNLLLFVFVVRRSSKGIYILIFSFLYILLNFFFSENNFWYEQVITTGLLLILLFNKYPSLQGITIALISFVKPTAAILLIPVLLFSRNKKILFSFLLSWIIVLFLFWINGGLPQMVSGLLTYNQYLFRIYPGHPLGDIRLIWFTVVLLLCALPAIFFSQKKSTGITLLSFILCSLVFLRLGYGKEHFTPLVASFILYLAWSTAQYNKSLRTIGIVLILIYTVFLLRQIKHLNAQLVTNRTAETITRKNLITSVRPFINNSTSLYIFGDVPKLYYSLRVFPATYYPADFPLIELFDTDYEKRILDALEKKHVDTILEPLPQQDRYLHMQSIRSYIQKNFVTIFKTNHMRIYIKK